jgi:DNA-binding transcriptional LysR family regulator
MIKLLSNAERVMDRLTSMAVFVAAADEGSLSRAARRFGLSASMAGKHVSAIEAELSIRLMQRSTRNLSLTDAGRIYYARCKRILRKSTTRIAKPAMRNRLFAVCCVSLCP